MYILLHTIYNYLLYRTTDKNNFDENQTNNDTNIKVNTIINSS